MGYRHSKPDAIKRLQGTVLSKFFSHKIGNMARAKITSNSNRFAIFTSSPDSEDRAAESAKNGIAKTAYVMANQPASVRRCTVMNFSS
jgi:hypothetical protein